MTLNPSENSDILTRDLYVDNVLTNMDFDEAVEKYYKHSRRLLQKGGFNLRPWKSNSVKPKNLTRSEIV